MILTLCRLRQNSPYLRRWMISFEQPLQSVETYQFDSASRRTLRDQRDGLPVATVPYRNQLKASKTTTVY